MKQEIAKQWVEALRSGKYKQGKDRLRFGDTFCCLGVACDLFGEVGWVEMAELEIVDKIYKYESSESTLPQSIIKIMGMKSDFGCLPGTKSLVSLNDSGKTFLEIADIIEKHWEEL